MSDYFDRFEAKVDAALQRRAQLPWYRRIRGNRSGSRLVAVCAACTVLVPAVAVSGWFVVDSPSRLSGPVAALTAGPHPTGRAELLSLDLQDPAASAAVGIGSRVCGSGRESAERAPAVDASLPRWLASTGS